LNYRSILLFVFSSKRWKLTATVWAHKPKVFDPVISVLTIHMIKNQD